MPTDYTFVTQSKYYSPVFNAALFDGPLRLYFAQAHEADALKLYFQVQDILGSPDIRRHFKSSGKCLYIMIYPTAESFEILFSDPSSQGFEATQLDQSPLIGIKGPLTADGVEKVVELILDFLRSVPLSSTSPQAEA